MMSATAAGSPSVDAGSAEGTAVVAVESGQRWPSGSNGWPHSGHGGRPAATTSSACLAKSRVSPRDRKHPAKRLARPPGLHHDLVADVLLGLATRSTITSIPQHPTPDRSCRPGTPRRPASSGVGGPVIPPISASTPNRRSTSIATVELIGEHATCSFSQETERPAGRRPGPAGRIPFAGCPTVPATNRPASGRRGSDVTWPSSLVVRRIHPATPPGTASEVADGGTGSRSRPGVGHRHQSRSRAGLRAPQPVRGTD